MAGVSEEVGDSSTQESGKEPVTTVVAVEEPTPHFREAFWGDSKSQVREKETAELVREDDSTHAYNTRLAGIPGVTTYSFIGDNLVSAGYRRAENPQLAHEYLADYQTLKAHLTSIYGNPLTDIRDWANDAGFMEGNQEYYAGALLGGQLKKTALWETSDTEISLSLYKSDDSKLILKIAADSKTFAVGESPTKEAGQEPITNAVKVEKPTTSTATVEETDTTFQEGFLGRLQESGP